MKLLALLTFLFASTFLYAQSTSYSISIIQDGKHVKIKTNEATISQSPFAIVYKFQGENIWSLIAGSNDTISNIFKETKGKKERFITDAKSGGAAGYFNEAKSIRAWDGEIETAIFFEDMEHHAFDSIYTKGKWIYGIRTIKKLSTKNESLLIEDWESDYLIIGTGKTTYGTIGKLTQDTQFIKLHLKKAQNEFPYTVKGKEYTEEGEAEYQEGCEGCGNLGTYDFLSNGKEVEYYRSGSDTGGFGTYEQIGDQVIIIEGELSFTVSPDGSYMTHNKYGTIYNLAKK